MPKDYLKSLWRYYRLSNGQLVSEVVYVIRRMKILAFGAMRFFFKRPTKNCILRLVQNDGGN